MSESSPAAGWKIWIQHFISSRIFFNPFDSSVLSSKPQLCIKDIASYMITVVLLGNFFSIAILFRLCHRAQTRTAIKKRRRDWEICNLITSFLANIPSTELEACFQSRIIHMQLHKYFDRVKRRKMLSMDSAHYIGSIKYFLPNSFFNTCAAWTFLMYRSHKNILIFIGTLYRQMFL